MSVATALSAFLDSSTGFFEEVPSYWTRIGEILFRKSSSAMAGSLSVALLSSIVSAARLASTSLGDR